MTHRLTATITLMVAMLMDLMDSTITNVALPAISTDLGATPTQLEWTLVGYVVAFATLLITGGRLGDIYGRKRIFLVGVIGFTCASVFASLSWDGNILIAARIIQGAFAGIMVPQVLSSVQVMYTPEERGPVFGVIGSLNALGVIAGLLLGGWLVTANLFGTGWRSIFLINVPVGIVVTVMAFLCIPESRSEHPLRLDIVGSALGATAVILLVLPLTEGRAAGWAWWIWTLLIIAPIAIIAFVWQQHRRAAGSGTQLLPLPLFRIRSFSSGLFVQILASIGHGGFALILLFHMQAAFHFTSFEAGLTLMPIAIGSILGTPVAMFLLKKLGTWSVCLGGIMQAAAYLWVMITLEHTGDTLNGWSLLGGDSHDRGRSSLRHPHDLRPGRHGVRHRAVRHRVLRSNRRQWPERERWPVGRHHRLHRLRSGRTRNAHAQQPNPALALTATPGHPPYGFDSPASPALARIDSTGPRAGRTGPQEPPDPCTEWCRGPAGIEEGLRQPSFVVRGPRS